VASVAGEQNLKIALVLGRHIASYPASHPVSPRKQFAMPDRLLGKEGWLGGDSLFIGICHDDPEVTPQDKIRYDACVRVDENFSPEGEIGVQVIPGGEYAVTTHFGPYQKLGDTYTKLLGQWLPHSGREMRSAPCFEVYLNDPQSTEPRDLITDIYAPLQSETKHRK
jgi:AraC family transcriptional regulator